MNLYKIIALNLIFSFIGYGANGSEEMDNTTLNRACVYKYSDDQDEETEVLSSSQDLTTKEWINVLSTSGPVHVNLIEAEITDSDLGQLVPFSSFIYGLSLSDNFLTNGSIDHFKKFSELRYLNVANNSFRQPTLDWVIQLKHLHYLNITYNKIDTSTVRSLKEKLRGVVIIFQE